MEHLNNQEIEPPWIKYSGYPPGDAFWRQSGEAWFHLVWHPFWESLSILEREKYLDRWKVPKNWHDFYFDTDFQKWLESID